MTNRIAKALRPQPPAPTNGNGKAPSARPAVSTAELGTTGLRQYGGYIQEEFHRSLQGDKALQVYTEMLNNSAVVGGVLFLIDMHMRRVPWRVVPGGESAGDTEAAEFLETCLHDMSMSWEDTLSEILSIVPYGFSYHEIVYKYRRGGDPLKPGTFSRYDDGRIGWRKLPIRAQVTRWKWDIAPDGGIGGMWQLPPTGAGLPVFIPIQKALLFRRGIHKNNPEGKSALRAAYRPYHFATRIEEIEGIGIERDLAGLPVAKIPSQIINAAGETYEGWKKAIRNVRRNEQDSLIIPSDVDPETKLPYYDVQLLSTGSRRQFDLNATVTRHEQRMALSMLADFLFLGQNGVGSHAQTKTRASIFATALDALLDQVCDVFNRHAIPRLMALNGFALETMPYLEHEPTETPDTQQLSAAIASLAGAGMPLFPDPKVENVLRHYLGLPEMNPEEMEEREQIDEEEKELEHEMQRAALEGQVATAQQGQKEAEAGKDAAEKALAMVQSMTRKGADVAPVHVHLPETLKLEASRAPAPVVNVAPPHVTVAAPVVHYHAPVQEPPQVTVQAAAVRPPDVVVNVPPAPAAAPVPKRAPRKRKTKFIKDGKGEIIGAETDEE